ncbi:MAG: hypothetical protein IKG08_02220 [Eubacterium sp.]|nr:hypothetical protein [Eubacterium sp.]
MTDQYLRSTTPDYISGAVYACDGIKDSIVLINGPLGCKFFYGFSAGKCTPRASDLWSIRGATGVSGAMSDTLLRSQYFTGSPHIPATNLRYEDFIFGTAEQLNRAVNDILSLHTWSFLAVIQAPGTSLLGEALEPELAGTAGKAGVPFLYIEAPELSANMDIGYDRTVVSILEKFRKKGSRSAARKRPSVNVFGLHRYRRHLEGDADELRRLLSLCGADVHCMVCSDCSLDELACLDDADANILLEPECCAETGRYLKENSDLPLIDIGFIPVGPDLTEVFVRKICAALGTDPAEAAADIEQTRARIYYHTARWTAGRGFPQDICYTAEGEASLLYAFADYLTGYLGLKPGALQVNYRKCPENGLAKLENLLKESGYPEAVSKDITAVNNAILLGSANTIAHVLLCNDNVFGIETMCPSSGFIDVVPKTYIGCRGALMLLEQVINGIRLLKAWE